MTIQSRMQKVMSLITDEKVLEKIIPGTWLNPNATNHACYTPLHSILNTHLFLHTCIWKA